MKRLILNADDLGYVKGINEGIIKSPPKKQRPRLSAGEVIIEIIHNRFSLVKG